MKNDSLCEFGMSMIKMRGILVLKLSGRTNIGTTNQIRN